MDQRLNKRLTLLTNLDKDLRVLSVIGMRRFHRNLVLNEFVTANADILAGFSS